MSRRYRVTFKIPQDWSVVVHANTKATAEFYARNYTLATRTKMWRGIPVRSIEATKDPVGAEPWPRPRADA